MQEDSYYAQYLEKTTGEFKQRQEIDSSDSLRRDDFAESNQMMVGLIHDLSHNLKSLARDVSLIPRETKLPNDVDRRLKELELHIAQTSEQISIAKDKFAWQVIVVRVNDLIPNYASIIKVLTKEGIIFGSPFGSAHNAGKPTELVITFGKNVALSYIRRIVELLKTFGFGFLCCH